MGEGTPANAFHQKDVQRWLLIGLLVRLLIMPFATHSDLLSVYHRAHLILDGEPVKILGPNLFSAPHAGFLWLIKPLLPYATMWSPGKAETYLLADWLGFVNNVSIFRTLFLFKLPYLAFEILAVWVLLKLVEPQRRARVTAFWVLNPIVIFSTYVFGRYDVIIVFLLLSAVYFGRQERPYAAMALLAVAMALRAYPIILVLPFALILRDTTWGRLRVAAVGFSPVIGAFLVSISGGPNIIREFTGLFHLQYPLFMKLPLFGQDTLYIFFFFYFLILFYLYVNPRSGFSSLKRYSFYVILTFFATSYFHPHYMIWLVPFVAFYIDDLKLLRLHHIQIGAWAVYTLQWGRALAGYLLAPLSPAFFWSLASPSEFIERFYPADQLVGIGRSLLSAALVAMMYVVWRRGRRRFAPQPAVAEREITEEVRG